eukprot:6697652-Prymnesium_polylepis.1
MADNVDMTEEAELRRLEAGTPAAPHKAQAHGESDVAEESDISIAASTLRRGRGMMMVSAAMGKQQKKCQSKTLLLKGPPKRRQGGRGHLLPSPCLGRDGSPSRPACDGPHHGSTAEESGCRPPRQRGAAKRHEDVQDDVEEVHRVARARVQ